MIRTAVVAPALAIRAGLAALLGTDADIQVVSESASLDDAALGESDVLVATAEAISLAGRLLGPQAGDLIPMLILFTEETDPGALLRELGGGIWGLLPLESTVEELLAAVRALHAGLFVGAPELMGPLLASSPAEDRSEPLLEDLTEREIEVLQLLAQGLANKQIAVRLGISEHTVKFHVSGIYGKLDATNRTEAVRIGVRQGLIVL